MDGYWGFLALLVSALLVGFLAVLFTLVWVLHYREGLGWDGTALEFNWHPVLLVTGFVFIQGIGTGALGGCGAEERGARVRGGGGGCRGRGRGKVGFARVAALLGAPPPLCLTVCCKGLAGLQSRRSKEGGGELGERARDARVPLSRALQAFGNPEKSFPVGGRSPALSGARNLYWGEAFGW